MWHVHLVYSLTCLRGSTLSPSLEREARSRCRRCPIYSRRNMTWKALKKRVSVSDLCSEAMRAPSGRFEGCTGQALGTALIHNAPTVFHSAV